MKPKVGVYSFSCCEGCGLMILNCEDALLELLEHVDLVQWREAMDPISEDLDVAFVEGSITRESEVPQLQHIRDHTKVLVALGACAWPAGVNALKNTKDIAMVKKYVYGDQCKPWDDTFDARPLDAVVKVDAYIRGCPIDRDEFLEVTKALLMGKRPQIPNYPVCVECKMKENVCLFHKGGFCLGPVTRAGCGAICPSFGDGCSGCRGPIPEPNKNAEKQILAEAGLTPAQVLAEFQHYGTYLEEAQ